VCPILKLINAVTDFLRLVLSTKELWPRALQSPYASGLYIARLHVMNICRGIVDVTALVLNLGAGWSCHLHESVSLNQRE
jgi:hypothetical protein